MIAADKNRHKRFTQLPVRWGRVLAVVCLIFVSATAVGVDASAVDDPTADALGGHEYPWYDAETRSVKPIHQPPGQKSSTQERNNVPIAKPQTGNGKGNNSTTTGGGGGGGGNITGEGAGTMFALIVAAIIIAVIVILVMTFLYIESGKSEGSESTVRSRKQSIEQLPFDLDTADGDFQSAADAAYRSGDLRKAIIYLYSHVLVTLDQNRLIRLRKGKTNRQYLREVQRLRGVSGYFQEVMLPFESVFFGDHEMDANQFQQCWSGLGGFHARVKDNAEALAR